MKSTIRLTDPFMKMNPTEHLIFMFAFIFLASVASAKELKSDKLNYTFTIPDGWTVTFQNSVGFSVASPDRKKTMTLLIRSANFEKLDSNSVATIEQDFLKAGSEKVSSKNFTIDGIPAHEIVYRVGKAPFASWFVDYLIIANNKLYFLGAGYAGGDATQNSEIQGGLTSFHFLQQPKPSRIGSLGVKLTVVGIIIIGIVFWVIRSRKV